MLATALDFFDAQNAVDQDGRPLSESPDAAAPWVTFKYGRSRSRLGLDGAPTVFNRSALDQVIRWLEPALVLIGAAARTLADCDLSRRGTLLNAWQATPLARWAPYERQPVDGAPISGSRATAYKLARGVHTVIAYAVLDGADPAAPLRPVELLDLAKRRGLLVRGRRGCAAPDALIVKALTRIGCASSDAVLHESERIETAANIDFAARQETLEFACARLAVRLAAPERFAAAFEETAIASLRQRLFLWGYHSPGVQYLSMMQASGADASALENLGRLGFAAPMDRSTLAACGLRAQGHTDVAHLDDYVRRLEEALLRDGMVHG